MELLYTRLFSEQLRIPLQNSEDTLIEFEKWGKANPNIVKESHIIEARNLHNVASKKDIQGKKEKLIC